MNGNEKMFCHSEKKLAVASEMWELVGIGGPETSL